ncbi:sorting nexin-18-like [Tubulanus polymorphus]|uniref:sorting nexin-18-like n=1 Tax=Tubulanus polymorphus TaxID=672921 RepID=UPI003DA3C0C6
MVDVQAQCFYDFEGNAPDGELTIYSGEILTIVNQNIGDGWWEARNASGQTGLVPEAYLQVLSAPEPAMAPPSAPLTAVTNHQESYNTQYQQQQQQPVAASQEPYDDWDDDWDDDESTIPDDSSSHTGHPAGDRQSKFGGTVRKGISSSVAVAPVPSTGALSSSWWFSTFAKSGGEAYLLGEATGTPNDLQKVTVVDTQYGPVWRPNDNPYTCIIASPKKESKFHGMKSFIAYQLTPSFSNIQVSRRYKHFDWLYKVMIEKFPCVSIPPLPDKQVSGRYEEDFISERMKFLQYWINRMSRHPVVSQCDVLMHFLSCTDEKRWKGGKRRAEKDEFVGAKFFLCVQTPAAPIELQQVENQVENFSRFVKTMDDNVKHLINVGEKNFKNHQGPFKREFQRVGHSFTGLANAFDLDTGIYSGGLTEAIKHTGKTYDDIGNLFSSQPPKDMVPLMDVLYEYKGILTGFPEIIQTHKSATTKVRECQKSQEEGKMTESEVQAIVSKCDTISYAVLSEAGYFQQERVQDFKVAMQLYLQEQIQFYKKITAKLEDALHKYDSV